MVNISESGAAQADGGWNIAQTAFHQDDISRINCDIGAYANRNADIGAGKRRGVIDAISHHSNLSFLLQRTDSAFFFMGQHVCYDFVNSSLAANGVGCLLVVSGEHAYINAHLLQFLHCTGAVFFDYVCNGNDTHKTFIFAKEQGSFSFLCQLSGRMDHFLRYVYLAADPFKISAK